ncbi:MAG: alpha/beta hydrolase [Pseudonocardia sp.]|nr:alpha/beta hydrolase [Pseudonocardia sp.]
MFVGGSDARSVARLNGVPLRYEVAGSGDLVVLVMGTASSGRVWKLHQVPALVAAGYRVATFDSRGVTADAGAAGATARAATPDAAADAVITDAVTTDAVTAVTIEDMVGDAAALIEHLGGGPARVVGTSLGARVAQELALARPDLVRQVVAMAAHARLDPLQRTLTRGEELLFDKAVELPAEYRAAVTAVLNLSPATLRDESSVTDWLDVFEVAGASTTAGGCAELAVSSRLTDRRAAYRAVSVPTLVVAFADDVMIPPYLSREVADAIPGARYAEVPAAGHFGYLERPDEVNRLLLEFFAASVSGGRPGA